MIPGLLSSGGAARNRGTHVLIATICLLFITVLLLASRSSLPHTINGGPQQNGAAYGGSTANGGNETPNGPPKTPKEETMAKDPLLDDVYNRTLGFQKIFVISLPTRQDRRDSMVLGASISDFDIEPRDGVRGQDVIDKSVPMPDPEKMPDFKPLRDGVRGAWRSHMNIMQEIVNKNIESAVVMEDDGDWDLRIKDQLRDLAIAAQTLTQPLAGPYAKGDIKYMDPTYPDPKQKIMPVTKEFDWDTLPDTIPAQKSPYGDAWDLLWLGHCSMQLPEFSDRVPKGRIVRHDDVTVPKKKFLHQNFVQKKLQDYEDHTRLYHHVPGTACLVAYAVTLKAARELLYQVALQPVVEAVDLGFANYCKRTGGKSPAICIATSPALFQHFRPVGSRTAESDISGHGNNYNSKAYSHIIRWSVKLNAEELMMGGTNFVDQYPDS